MSSAPSAVARGAASRTLSMDLAVSHGAAIPLDTAAPSAVVGEAAAQAADARGAAS